MAEKKVTKTTEEKKVSLNKNVWEVPYNGDLVSQVLGVYFSNERKGTSNAKTRGDVSGGGIKPWRQKGTGRARSGSIRSPLWVGGGVTFVPNNKNWSKRINKGMARKATCIMLSERLRKDELEFINIEATELNKIRKNIEGDKHNRIMVISDDANVIAALRNMEKIITIEGGKVNAKHLASAKKILIDNNVVKLLEERLTNGK